MADGDEIKNVVQTTIKDRTTTQLSEKSTSTLSSDNDFNDTSEKQAEFDLNVTEDHLLEAQAYAQTLTLSDTKAILERTLQLHEYDPNFPSKTLATIREGFETPEVFENPEINPKLSQELKVEAALITINSPYAEVRAVVSNTDDPTTPCSTIRAWIIGLFFVACIAVVNQLFSIRQPSITVDASVIQLLSYPVGKAFERFLPDVGFTLFGIRHSLNPGRFTKKEHMLITIMANVGQTLPSSRYIIWTQFLKQYFNQSYAGQFAYQILLALSVDLMGYGLAGLCRQFLVYPAYCLYPQRLVTIAMNNSLHDEENPSVVGWFNKTFQISRFKFFTYACVGMFIYFWFPNYIFTALSAFNWLAWTAPDNTNLAAITGIKKGLGFNPLPTFDWNMVVSDIDPLVIPFRTTINKFIGLILGGILIIVFWYNNFFYTSYLPINSNALFNHNATTYSVSKILDSRGWLDEAKYQAYSPVYMAASNLVMYFFFFAVYAATISFIFLYHRHEIMLGLKSLFDQIKNKTKPQGDIHVRLMASYREVPEWWYLMLNVAAIALGVAALAGWKTYTNVGVVFFGIGLAALFVIPAGLIYSTTGILIELNVLAEFIGGALSPGNALAMNFFKCYGYATTAHALAFSADLKLAQYTKIPPRHTFWAQIIATIVSAFVATGIINFQIRDIENVCQVGQKDKFTCPGVNTYFSAAVLFGSIGAKKVFGQGGQYGALLSAFPIGFAFPIVLYFIQKRWPTGHWISKIHPVALLSGGIAWSPYNFSYMWPAIPIAWLSMIYTKTRYLAFWSKYNYVLSAAFSTGIALSAILIFFTVEFPSVSIDWWGNNADTGCESTACVRMKLAEGEYFGPRIGQFA